MQMLSLIEDRVKFYASSKRYWFLLVIAMGLAALTFGLPRLFSQRSSAHGLDSASPKYQGCCANLPATLRRMIGAYYTTEDNFKSTLILNNKGPNQIVVTPILYGQNGQTFNAPPVSVGGESSYELNLNEVAMSAGPQFRSGSLEFTYMGRMLEIGGGLRIVDAEKSLIFDEQFLEPGMKFSSPQLEAVYAIPYESARVSLILTNTAQQPLRIDGNAIFDGEKNQRPIQVQLKSHETQVVILPNGNTKEATAGAVSLNHNGGSGALLAMVHVQESDKGFSVAVNFTDPSRGKTNQLHGAGLRLGSINNDLLKPVIVVRNIGKDATSVAASVPFSMQNGKTGKISLPPISLAPGEIRLFDTSNPQLRQRDFATAGLEIEYKGTPGSVIATAHSVSQSGNHVFALPLKDPQGGLSSTGGYPWFVDGSASTVVFIKNVTSEPQECILEIVYPSGRWGSKHKLSANQTLAVDVRAIRDSQQKDSDGDAIPPDATAGHVYWGLLGGKNKMLIGRAQTVDFVKGLASTYECQCLCPPVFGEARLLPGSVSGFPGDTQQFTAQERFRNCFNVYGDWYDVSPTRITFSVDNPSVASINSSGLGTALAPGSTYIRASWESDNWVWDNEVGWCFFYAAAAACAAFCDVLPPVTISGPNTLWWFFNENPTGYATSITLTASPPNASIYYWTVTRGYPQVRFQDDSLSTSTSTNQVVLKSINSSGVENDIGVKVTVNGRTSNELVLTSRTPWRLLIESISHYSHATRGYESVWRYQIFDQIGSQLPSTVPINEKFTSLPIPDVANNWEPAEENGTFVHPSNLPDYISPPTIDFFMTPTPTSPSSPPGSSKVVHRPQEWYVGSTMIGKGRRVQTSMLQYYLDHGDVLGITSPNP